MSNNEPLEHFTESAGQALRLMNDSGDFKAWQKEIYITITGLSEQQARFFWKEMSSIMNKDMEKIMTFYQTVFKPALFRPAMNVRIMQQDINLEDMEKPLFGGINSYYEEYVEKNFPLGLPPAKVQQSQKVDRIQDVQQTQKTRVERSSQLQIQTSSKQSEQQPIPEKIRKSVSQPANLTTQAKPQNVTQVATQHQSPSIPQRSKIVVQAEESNSKRSEADASNKHDLFTTALKRVLGKRLSEDFTQSSPKQLCQTIENLKQVSGLWVEVGKEFGDVSNSKACEYYSKQYSRILHEGKLTKEDKEIIKQRTRELVTEGLGGLRIANKINEQNFAGRDIFVYDIFGTVTSELQKLKKTE
ncbi:Hypothetical_protein [Hexamita inflata]|uniref:Hypothetical_protein n=1 Tax=Hexamita inflata TaxID=28002 RepID=A0AA86Q258_9EUKA|nr:Hypothetical protein HINF_LOCUS37513 [Hexamita inflata]CAI9960469.1 Hypothetical protein HINF_LOCUS48114 [Hexamita inflata]